MIGTGFLKGQGLGNQLFCYVSARCLAIDLKCDFGCLGKEQFGYNIHNNRGVYFMDIDLGGDLDEPSYTKYYEKEERIVTPTCWHDAHIGCYISSYDDGIYNQVDNTIIYGNLQAEKYFDYHRAEIREWLKVKPEYEKYNLSDENTCILNMRGGEYIGNKALYLKKSYWIMAMDRMREINPNMRFVIVTEDVEASRRMFPDLEIFHGELADDYTRVKNAYYLILSNSSFGFFPAYTSDTVRFIIAPKYWARYNVSDGYWSSEQNIYSGWHYLDRRGRLFTSEECRKELALYKLNKHMHYIDDNSWWNMYCRIITDCNKVIEDVIRFISYKIDGINKRIKRINSTI